MTLRIAINGFGRIGRMVFRKAVLDPSIEVVAINASYPAETLAHLIKYDTIHGMYHHEVTASGEGLIVNGHLTKLVSNRDPWELPWKELGIDVVVEATGKFCDREGASKHLQAGAKKVVITAPGKNEDITIVMGVNESDYDAEQHHIISNASCTTNCLAPVVKVLHQAFGIEHGLMTTVHAYTNDQKNLDNPHKDLRRARACAQSIIPTKTGAARALGLVIPELKGKLNGFALRVPTPNVSVVDLVADLRTKVTAEEVNAALKAASGTTMEGIIQYCDQPLVSSDFNGNSHSSIIDALSTMVIGDRQIKVLAWYDNEWGYSCRVVDLVKYTGKTMTQNRQLEEVSAS
ncbi:glyceraldehyde-3-phosphate dehydrogenase [Paenactinomyces guangxiensis]|uniref:Glyceraldehyde-3-phosphate dehydrogenase n=1 Tax=Paenactinomyces guangxiensis TaxID=1490290 RepID=A0A7W2AA65_9BACL|nr:glyceraldehyde-3-phosphate dehydrogenase [Paenactinomyces guangxiensis]MBA4496460.1 glyceraldehyde-3-phosphate dehydrogenase [Paenactinomyces guangxiensis]MBH8593576.1 glyceraldehyde-3-phosphate dehydrogenase [Paenactinomyces guangxiensis]